MRHATVTLFFALLAVAAFAVTGVGAALSGLSRRSAAAAEVRESLVGDLRGQALSLAAVVATFATLGSLYLSEVIGYPPCFWCWVQRGFMYPLAVVLVVAAARGWEAVRGPARIWALIGAATSAYHVAVERVPALQGAAVCDTANPCDVRWVEHLGFVTIPVMALAAFLLVITLLSVRTTAPATPDTEPDMEHTS